MHVPHDRLEEYRELMDMSRKLDSLAGTYSGKGRTEQANELWSAAATIKKSADRLRVPGARELAQAEHRETAYCRSCGETCKEWYSDHRGWGWNCLDCGYLTSSEVSDIAKRENPVYSDGSPVRWV